MQGAPLCAQQVRLSASSGSSSRLTQLRSCIARSSASGHIRGLAAGPQAQDGPDLCLVTACSGLIRLKPRFLPPPSARGQDRGPATVRQAQVDPAHALDRTPSDFGAIRPSISEALKRMVSPPSPRPLSKLPPFPTFLLILALPSHHTRQVGVQLREPGHQLVGRKPMGKGCLEGDCIRPTPVCHSKPGCHRR